MRQIIDRPSPLTGGKLELCTEPATVSYRGETISYEKSFYHCVETDMEFVDEELEKANLKRIYDTYRHQHGIPTAEALKKMRERYGIPSSAMSIILGLGENQFGLYEEGTVPTPSVGKLLALAADPAIMREMLQFARMFFSEKQYNKYYDAILTSMQPAWYVVEESGLFDYGVFYAFPASIVHCKPFASSPRKTRYNEYNSYARAC